MGEQDAQFASAQMGQRLPPQKHDYEGGVQSQQKTLRAPRPITDLPNNIGAQAGQVGRSRATSLSRRAKPEEALRPPSLSCPVDTASRKLVDLSRRQRPRTQGAH